MDNNLHGHEKPFHYINNISLLVGIVFFLIATLIPSMSLSINNQSGHTSYLFGGIGWFTNEGWLQLRNNAINPALFYFTFCLFLVTLFMVIFYSIKILSNVISSFSTKTKVTAQNDFFILSIWMLLYFAIYGITYSREIYLSGSKYSNYTSISFSSGYYLAIFAFIIPIVPLFISKVLDKDISEQPNGTLFAIFTSIILFCLPICFVNAVDNAPSIHNAVNQNYAMLTLTPYTALDYFGNSIGTSTILFVLALIFSLIMIASTVILTTLIAYNFFKNHTINHVSIIVLGAIDTICTILTYIFASIAAGNYYNTNNYYINGGSNLLCMIIFSIMTLAFGITMLTLSKKKKVTE